MNNNTETDGERICHENQILKQQVEQLDSDLQEQVEATSTLYEQLAALYHLFAVFGQSLDDKTVPVKALEFCSESLHARVGFIGLLQDDKVLIRHSIGLPSGTPSQIAIRDGEGLFQYCQRKKTTVIVNDFSADDRMRSPFCEQIDIRRLVCSPLILNGAIIGFIVLASPENDEDFTAGDGQMLTSISHPITNVLENVRLRRQEMEKKLMERELEIAQQIQKRLLPQIPQDTPGTSIDGRTIPARTIGGDYFDFFRLDETRLAITLADTVGKGVSAGLLMTMLKGALHALPLSEYSPGEVLQSINEAFIRQRLYDRFITMVYLIYDLHKRTLLLSNAGHHPPMLFEGNSRSTREFHGVSLPIGVLTEQQYPVFEIPLSQGDVLVIYSDGVTEAMDHEGNQFGIQAFRDAIVPNVHLDASAIADILYDSIRAHVRDADQHDDMTSVVMKAEIIEMEECLAEQRQNTSRS